MDSALSSTCMVSGTKYSIVVVLLVVAVLAGPPPKYCCLRQLDFHLRKHDSRWCEQAAGGMLLGI